MLSPQYADPSDEPESHVYDQTFEDYELSIQDWKGQDFNINLASDVFNNNLIFVFVVRKLLVRKRLKCNRARMNTS